MKLQIANDLHLEFLQQLFPGERLISLACCADLLVLAGDIAKGLEAIELFRDWPVPVLYLAGLQGTRPTVMCSSRYGLTYVKQRQA